MRNVTSDQVRLRKRTDSVRQPEVPEVGNDHGQDQNLQGNMKVVVWPVAGLVVAIVFGLVWHLIEPGLAIWFWPAFGVLIFGQHAYRSSRRVRNKDDEESMPPTE